MFRSGASRAAMVIAIALGLAGCAQDTAPVTPAPSPTTREAAFAVVDESLIGGLTHATLSGDGVTTAVPEVSRATALNLAAQIVRNKALRARGRSGGTVDVTWHAIAASNDLLGVVLTVATAGGSAGEAVVPVSLWYAEGARTVATGAVLIDPGSWDAFVKAVAADVGAKGGDEAAATAALGSPGAPQGTGPAIGFDESGDLVVSFAGRAAGAADALLTVSIDKDVAQEWLSEFGDEALGAATHPSHYTQGVDGPGVTTLATAAAGSRPDADVVGDCRSRKCVALTFDDGPGERTAEAVAALADAGVAATFFQLGSMIEEDPAGVKAVALSGSEVASHTWRHNALPASGDEAAKDQVRRNAVALQKITGDWPVMMRPPYGSHNRRINKIVGAQNQVLVQWTIDTLDWKTKSTEATIASATGAEAGDIVLMHDIHATTVDAIPEIVSRLTEAGFTLVPVAELSSPNTWQTGAVYCAAPWRKRSCW
ncbi:polysaccharide deacetylase family protein [Propionicicella superfundia]|uniref:polysaccharide deacetylase family protein n=1 Tax=Propionicicella superfundia TaxID=348582 RepID=UPI0003FE1448|nr:polysaccharide deacetylase family protein [Propionicicella superfundia]